MRYGFLIDQHRCIGCHACTVACKEEHNIPLGVNRTWVKYVEKGGYPDTRRHFAVLRCNHCDEHGRQDEPGSRPGMESGSNTMSSNVVTEQSAASRMKASRKFRCGA